MTIITCFRRAGPAAPAGDLAPTAAGLRRTDAALRRAEEAAARWAGLPAGVTRWRLAAALRTAARQLRLSCGMLRLLEHYIDATYDQDWTADAEPIVYRPLVETAEALGLGERQVRNLERGLLERGLLCFRDSGNHHRHGRRDRKTGRIVYAYGPSLAPAGARTAEILALADAARAQTSERRRLRAMLSATRRRLRADLAAATADGLPTDDLVHTLATTPADAPAGLSLAALAARCEAMSTIASTLAARLTPQGPVHAARCDDGRSEAATAGADGRAAPTHEIANEMANEAGQPEISSRPDTDTSRDKGVSAYCSDARQDDREGRTSDRDLSAGIPLTVAVAAAGPLIRMSLGDENTRTWGALTEAGRAAAPLLGIDHQLWGEACGRLGRRQAALAMVIIERGVERRSNEGLAPIRAPAAYLRAMMTRAEHGTLHIDRSIRGLASRSRVSRQTDGPSHALAAWAGIHGDDGVSAPGGARRQAMRPSPTLLGQNP